MNARRWIRFGAVAGAYVVVVLAIPALVVIGERARGVQKREVR